MLISAQALASMSPSLSRSTARTSAEYGFECTVCAAQPVGAPAFSYLGGVGPFVGLGNERERGPVPRRLLETNCLRLDAARPGAS